MKSFIQTVWFWGRLYGRLALGTFFFGEVLVLSGSAGTPAGVVFLWAGICLTGLWAFVQAGVDADAIDRATEGY